MVKTQQFSFNPRLFWSRIDDSKSLYSRTFYLWSQMNSMMGTLSADADFSDLPNKPGMLSNQRLKWVLVNHGNTRPGQDSITEFRKLRTQLDKFGRLRWANDGKIVSDKDLQSEGFDEESYLYILWRISQFIVWAYEGLVIPESIEKKCEEVRKHIVDPDLLVLQAELEKISEQDLADNPGNRFPCIIIIDNGLNMNNYLRSLEDEGLASLFDEIYATQTLAASMELYVATCGGGVHEYVTFATIDRQKPLLDAIQLTPFGLSRMGETICNALDKLQERIRLMRTPDYGVSYFKPWLIILSNGKFKDPRMEEAYQRVKQMQANRELYVLPIGISKQANMENLKRLSPNAFFLEDTSLQGLFKDVFSSLKKSQFSQPGGDDIEFVHSGAYSIKR